MLSLYSQPRNHRGRGVFQMVRFEGGRSIFYKRHPRIQEVCSLGLRALAALSIIAARGLITLRSEAALQMFSVMPSWREAAVRCLRDAKIAFRAGWLMPHSTVAEKNPFIRGSIWLILRQ